MRKGSGHWARNYAKCFSIFCAGLPQAKQSEPTQKGETHAPQFHNNNNNNNNKVMNVSHQQRRQWLMQTKEVSKGMKQAICTIFWIVNYMYARIKDLPIKVNRFHFQTIGDWIYRLKLIDWCTVYSNSKQLRVEFVHLNQQISNPVFIHWQWQSLL